MKYSITAKKNEKSGVPNKVIEMSLDDFNKSILDSYLSDSTKNSLRSFLKWKASSGQICENLKLDCNELELIQMKNQQVLDSYQVANIYINIDTSVDSSGQMLIMGLMVTLGMKKIENPPSEEPKPFLLVTSYGTEKSSENEKVKFVKQSQHLSLSLSEPEFLL